MTPAFGGAGYHRHMAWNPQQPPQGKSPFAPGHQQPPVTDPYGYQQLPEEPAGPSKLRAIGGLVILLLCLAATFVILFVGPGKAINDWQADHLFRGYYYPKLTFVIVFLGVMVPLFVPWMLIVKIVEGKRRTP
jgi:hypothetical protein